MYPVSLSAEGHRILVSRFCPVIWDTALSAEGRHSVRLQAIEKRQVKMKSSAVTKKGILPAKCSVSSYAFCAFCIFVFSSMSHIHTARIRCSTKPWAVFFKFLSRITRQTRQKNRKRKSTFRFEATIQLTLLGGPVAHLPDVLPESQNAALAASSSNYIKFA
jgi:NAD-dependent oxidoreductase involved in siderophore biosynthesis